tara:strand:+ start:1328 stop:2545 length:1218 start_codon:yes stop_codon:yes gene_type:complete
MLFLRDMKLKFVLFAILLFTMSFSSVNAEDETVVYMFGRDDCGYCQAEKEWLDDEGISYEYLNIVRDKEANELFRAIANKHDLSKVTPLTIVGEKAFLGFNGGQTTGKMIKNAIPDALEGDIKTPEDHLEYAPAQDVVEAEACTDEDCEAATSMAYVFDLPLIGLVDLKALSLFSLSALLGTIDGFNPCAMWVLITFLVLLSQAGSRSKMVFLAGIFIVAEAVMYNLILNVWYKTWDFVALDQVVTPLVGLLALGGGLFFLYRWRKNRGVALVCDISDIESQNKTINKFQKIVSAPLTLTTIGALLVIAFSVNIIEFACSIGIPQAYTKILDINNLAFLERQFYILIYTFGYMLDDLVVFGLAIWGYDKLHAHGHKYSQASLLIGGALMVLLGALLVLNPELLVL